MVQEVTTISKDEVRKPLKRVKSGNTVGICGGMEVL